MIRGLTGGERALAVQEFGAALDLDPIRLIGSPWPFDRAFVPGRIGGCCWIVWPARSLPDDIAVAPVGVQSTFIHELVHVWQAQQGVNLLFGKLRAGDGPRAYAYAADFDCEWTGLNIEQQAMVIEHRFRRRRGFVAPGDEAFYARVCPTEFTEPQSDAIRHPRSCA